MPLTQIHHMTELDNHHWENGATKLGFQTHKIQGHCQLEHQLQNPVMTGKLYRCGWVGQKEGKAPLDMNHHDSRKEQQQVHTLKEHKMAQGCMEHHVPSASSTQRRCNNKCTQIQSTRPTGLHGAPCCQVPAPQACSPFRIPSMCEFVLGNKAR